MHLLKAASEFKEPDFDPTDPYSILGVKKNAKKKAILKAFKERAHWWHPDKCGNSDKFLLLLLAKNTLLDKKSRSLYDDSGVFSHEDSNFEFLKRRAISDLQKVFCEILLKMPQLETHDIIPTIKKSLRNGKQDLQNNLQKARKDMKQKEAKIENLEKLMTRLHVKNDAPEEKVKNVVPYMKLQVKETIRVLGIQVLQEKEKIKDLSKKVEILIVAEEITDYLEWDHDHPETVRGFIDFGTSASTGW